MYLFEEVYGRYSFHEGASEGKARPQTHGYHTSSCSINCAPSKSADTLQSVHYVVQGEGMNEGYNNGEVRDIAGS
jgi:hypothetical protein